MEWSANDTNETTVNTTTSLSSSNAAEDFARYIYHQWTTTMTLHNTNTNNHRRSDHEDDDDKKRILSTMPNHTSIMSSSSSSSQRRNIEQQQQRPTHINYPLLILIAKEDQMVYIARPIRDHPKHMGTLMTDPWHHANIDSDTTRNHHHVASVLSSIRLERLLRQHMMIHLQHSEYVRAIQEFMSGIDFYMKYGPHKVSIWEQILTYIVLRTNMHHYHEQMYWMFVSLLISMAFVCINWYPILQLYEHYLYHRINHYYHTGVLYRTPWMMIFQKHNFNISMSPLNQEEYHRAEQLRQKYHVQDSCPICLEPFITLPVQQPTMNLNKDRKDHQKHHSVDSLSDPIEVVVADDPLLYSPVLGSDHQPIILLRCGHVYDTTCWTKWMIHNYHHHQQQQQHQSTPQSRLKCLICQQPVE
jgi:hypothetical protein